jgi:hypothetical protein
MWTSPLLWTKRIADQKRHSDTEADWCACRQRSGKRGRNIRAGLFVRSILLGRDCESSRCDIVDDSFADPKFL